jgi:acetoin utilization deacetylase AcuC-like enzyme
MSTLILSHNDCFNHIEPVGHPEQVKRIKKVLDVLKTSKFSDLTWRDAPLATREQIELCHSTDYVKSIEEIIIDGSIAQIDADTYFGQGSLAAAKRAVGANILAVDSVMSGEFNNAFAAIRPPGHHAETSKAMGFCIFGNVAIAAKYALKNYGLERVAVVDFDVHHGNGTQDLLWHEPKTLFCSMHQSPLWPGSGKVDETGAFDNVLNIPIASNTAGDGVRSSFNEIIIPKLEEFKPELLIISAGFDAHISDPLANLELVEEDYEWITHKLCDIVDKHCNGRLVSSLEGGYNLEALAASVAVHVKVMMERSK